METGARPEGRGESGGDRGRALLAVVAALACGGALYAALSSSGGEAPAPCPDARVDGAVVSCGEADEAEGAGARAWLLGEKLDLNRASAADLARIPGIGKSLARAIVDERARRGGFRSLKEVDGVRGVGPAKLRLLARYVEVRDGVSATPPAARDP